MDKGFWKKKKVFLTGHAGFKGLWLSIWLHARTAEWIVRRICAQWGKGAFYEVDRGPHPREALFLKPDCSEARARLDRRPRWNLEQAIKRGLEWVRVYQPGGDIREVCRRRIREYEGEP